MEENSFDVIVIGSGFGGSVMTHRLTEKNLDVCLLERGREYPINSFPRRLHEIKEKLFWEPTEKSYGYMEVRDDASSEYMSLTSSGLGGGSLIYANVLLRLKPEYFQDWPYQITADVLEPHYKTVIDMMDASPYPFGKDPYYTDTPKTKAYRDAATTMELTEDMLEKPSVIEPDLAINFKGDFPGEQILNKHGKLQSKCNKCGECDIGCNIHAKNTLDHNYLFVAKKNGANIRTNAEVIDIEGTLGSYEVTYQNPISKEQTKIKAKKVIVCAGAIGSTRLLMKLRSKGRLPNISNQLGKNICGNGDFLAFSNDSKQNFDPTNGPVITTAIEYKMKPYPDGYKHVMYLEDAGFPVSLAWLMSGKIPQAKVLKGYFHFLYFTFHRWILKVFRIKQKKSEVNLGKEFSDAIDNDHYMRSMFVHLAMGRDRNNGEMVEEGGDFKVRWFMKESGLHFKRVVNQLKKYTRVWGGKFMRNPIIHVDKIIAVHPLGGCIMGESKETGVVNENGEVFGHDGLYVVDGSIIPTSLGPNPSLTIAAMAEKIASNWK